MRRVTVVGGSIGGFTAAVLLRDAGLDVHVYERSPFELEAPVVVGDVLAQGLQRRQLDRRGDEEDGFLLLPGKDDLVHHPDAVDVGWAERDHEVACVDHPQQLSGEFEFKT